LPRPRKEKPAPETTVIRTAACAQAVGRYVADNAPAFAQQIDPDNGKPYKNAYDPRKWLREGERGIANRLTLAFRQLGSAGRSVARRQPT
jgi:fructose-bisphosphate aldolase class II